ncbi:uncharacterized protein LOC132547969 [Ylistrum balloti]|uniref:uncharacterized protein LOC132547969 n=1 Tax=Ylistrum balloti TaxID=509963 RepID=UPI002905F10F|nr:uncharacterized protein LOC132547969 [Ylistrum balloti]
MNHRCIWLFAATCCVYLSVNFSSVSAGWRGKCRGRWSIHACLGGNGKRSGPQSALPNSGENSGLFLKKLLLRSDDPTSGSDSYSDMDSFYPPIVQDTEDAMDIPMVLDNPDLSTEQLQRLSDLVDELIYRKKLRSLSDEAGLV